MRGCAGGVTAAAAAATLLAGGCSDGTAPEEARFPIVEGIYNVETTILRNSCGGVNVVAGSQIFVFFQDGGRLEFRPPSFNGLGRVEFLDLGIAGDVRPDGSFRISGSYTMTPSFTGPGVVVGFEMEGRFDGDRLEGVQRQIPAFAAGSCEVTFGFTGEEV